MEINVLKQKRWLFVCAYGESRSVYFAERFNEMGIKAQFISEQTMKETYLPDWADNIVILDKDVYKVHLKWLENISDIFNKKIIKNFIEDKPSNFEKEFDKFIQRLGLYE